MLIKIKDENIAELIAYHQNRIAEYKAYRAGLTISRERAEAENNSERINQIDETLEASRQRVKENEEIIRELTERLQ